MRSSSLVGWVAAAVLAFSAGAAPAQMSPTQSVNCDDPSTINSPACQPQERPQRSTVPEPRTSNSSQQQDSTSREVYLDSAGFPQSRTPEQQAQDQEQRRRLNRPELPTEFQRLAQQSTGELLPIFGRELFRTPPSTFAPADQIPASPDYVVGPGDEVMLRIWGHTSFNSRLTVDRSGAIYVPQVGAINVAGLRFQDLQEHIKHELSRTYRNFDLSVNLGKLRSIQVFVLGEAYAPGTYVVSSLSTVFNALLVSGGPTLQGSLRNVQVRRGSQVVAMLDLYDLILNGDRSADIVLQSGDVIFIPFVGAQVALSGSVRHPAIYEVKPATTVGELVKQAGGLNATASDTRVAIERIEGRRERQAMTVALDAAGLGTRLLDGDVLHVNPVLSGYKDSVTIRGNLANAGRFPWHPGMKLSEILPDRESLLTNDYWRQRNRLGLPTPLFEPLRQPRQQGFNRQDELSLQGRTGDQGQRSSQDELSTDGPPSADGNDSAIYPYGTRYSRSGDSEIDPRARPTATDRNQYPDANTMSSSRGSIADQQAVSARNLAPDGRKTEIKVSVPEIDWSYAVIQRLSRDTLRNSLVPFDLGKLVNGHDASQDLRLQPGDVVTILSQNDVHVRQDEQTKYVRLEGEFVNSGVYSVEPGQTLIDVVRMAGGLTDKAYLYGSSFTRETARVLQQERLNEYVGSLRMQMERSSAERTVSATAAALAGGQQLNDERSLLNQLASMRATGRVVLEFKPDSSGSMPIPPITLEDGDTFRVPSRPAIVSVVGSVYGQNVFLYDGAKRVRDYLQLAGKPNRIADRKHSFVIRADGSIFSNDTSGGIWGDRFNSALLFPGDTIVVPEKPIKPSALRDVIDWSQVFSQFAIGAAAIQVIR